MCLQIADRDSEAHTIFSTLLVPPPKTQIWAPRKKKHVPHFSGRKKSIKINVWGPEFEERSLGHPGNVAAMSRTPGVIQKVCAKKNCSFSAPNFLEKNTERGPTYHWEIKGRFRKRVVLANVPLFRFSFRGNIRRNHPFGNHPFANPKKGH